MNIYLLWLNIEDYSFQLDFQINLRLKYLIILIDEKD